MKKDAITKLGELMKAADVKFGELDFAESKKKITSYDLNVAAFGERKVFAPFSYFGGKRDIAPQVWEFFGARIKNYIEPFAGGMAILLARPNPSLVVEERFVETVNDKDALVINAWRAMKHANPRELAELVETINSQQHLDSFKKDVYENYYMLNRLIRSGTERYHPYLAAMWIAGMKNAIGAGFANTADTYSKVSPRIVISGWPFGSAERYFKYMKYRLKHVNLMCLNWHELVGSPTRTTLQGETATFIDPPYPRKERSPCYNEDDGSPSNAAAEWAIETIRKDKANKFRIAFCGYRRLYKKKFKAEGWTSISWKGKGYGVQGDGRGRVNAAEETVWFSPVSR